MDEPTSQAGITVGEEVLSGRRFGLRERLWLTYEHHGFRALVYRLLTFPLRFTPLKRHLRLAPRSDGGRVAAIRWYRKRGRPVTIVIASYRDSEQVATLVASLRRTTKRSLTRILVADDASGPEHVQALRRIDGIEVIAAETNAGLAANVNRGVRAADPDHDVVILN
ncbi:MAG: glycosyltransferase family 2 protein, partial [Solirubrobacteraceae bacterium]